MMLASLADAIMCRGLPLNERARYEAIEPRAIAIVTGFLSVEFYSP